MPLYVTRAQARRIDSLAIEQYGIPGIVLMENAARNAAGVALVLLAKSRTQRVAVLCGGGNNGGDGFAAARHLHNAGVQVAVTLVAPPARLAGDAAINWNILERLNLTRHVAADATSLAALEPQWRKSDLLVDALLGTGFSGELKPHMAAAIAQLNRAAAARRGPRVLALDLPSGMDCDSGQPAKPTVRADSTVTFAARKIGFQKACTKPYLGRVVLADIGVPAELIERAIRECQQ
jgi:NAD(P)H-hydrate epimerase